MKKLINDPRAVVDESLDQIAQADGMARRGLVLKLLTALNELGRENGIGRLDLVDAGLSENQTYTLVSAADAKEQD